MREIGSLLKTTLLFGSLMEYALFFSLSSPVQANNAGASKMILHFIKISLKTFLEMEMTSKCKFRVSLKEGYRVMIDMH